MMARRTLTLEALLWTAVFALTTFLRLQTLGDRPLDASEAREALAAAAGTPQESAFWPTGLRPAGTSALYHVLTKGMFTLGGAGDGAARAVPALAGLVPVIVIWALRRRLGPWVSLAAGLAIAVSPSWVAASRLAGGASLAVGAMASAILMALETKSGGPWTRRALLGAVLGLGAASGPAFLTGLLGLLAAAWLARKGGGASETAIPLLSWPAAEKVEVALWALGTALLVSTGVGFVWSGLAVLGSGLRVWLTGWIVPGSLALGSALLIFLVYEPLATMLGSAEAFRSLRRSDFAGRFFSAWLLVGVLLFLGKVGRAPEDVLWPTAALALLAARFIGRELETADRLAAPGVAAVLMAVLLGVIGFAQIQLSAYASGIGPAADITLPALRLPIAAGAVGLALLLLVLVGLGWDWAIARAGGISAAIVFLVLMTVSASWSLNISEDPDVHVQLWRPTQAATGLSRLRSTLESLAYFQTGTRSMPLTVSRSITADVAWAVRGFEEFEEAVSGPEGAPPAILVPEAEPLPRLPSEYIGQSIPSSHRWLWGEGWPSQLLTWMLRRTGPKETSVWVLYVRRDLATLTHPTESDSP